MRPKRNKISFIATGVTILFLATHCSADFRLPTLLSDNMVLQQNSQCLIWGWTNPGDKITIESDWSELKTKCIANNKGEWKSKIQTPEAGGPYNITIKSKNDLVVIKNVLIGEVWICAGQSNMQMPLMGWNNTPVKNMETELKNANFASIRMFNVQGSVALKPANNCEGKWTVCNHDGAKWFSAVGYFFARELHEKLNVPIGMINSSWGDTPAEAWMPINTLTQSSFEKIKDQYTKDRSEYIADSENKNTDFKQLAIKFSKMPSGRFNGMIAPLENYEFIGAIWYQGENNRSRAHQYQTLFPELIKGWRKTFQKKEMPFYYAQLTSYYEQNPTKEVLPVKSEPCDDIWAELREAQLMTMQLKNTGMAVTIDVGSPNNIHPPDKQTVGKRLSLWALAKNYGFNNPYSGPTYQSFTREGNQVRLSFNFAENGLKYKGDELTGFAIADNSRLFKWAKAKIEKNTVVVYSDEIETPVAVRYGWGKYPECNLYNTEGLPASPFRTDNWPGITYDK